jgi:dienelactone hydrolase
MPHTRSLCSGPLALLGCLALLALSACRHRPADVHIRQATPPGAGAPQPPPPGYYEAGGPIPAARTDVRLWRHAQAELRRIEVPARVPPALEHVPRAHDPIEILWMQPRPLSLDPRPLILVSPILSNKLTLMNAFASGFVRQGYSVAILPRKELAFDPYRSFVEAEAESRLVVLRARQALDWLGAQPQVDAGRVGVFGISAGGIVAASLLGADPRVKAGVLVFAGAPMADVFVASTEDSVREKIREAEQTQGWSRSQIRQMLFENLRTDPLVLAPRVKRESVLMFIATKDDSVPTATQKRLWEALGRPESYELSAGHYSGVALFLPFLLQQSQHFLAKRLGTP